MTSDTFFFNIKCSEKNIFQTIFNDTITYSSSQENIPATFMGCDFTFGGKNRNGGKTALSEITCSNHKGLRLTRDFARSQPVLL